MGRKKVPALCSEPLRQPTAKEPQLQLKTPHRRRRNLRQQERPHAPTGSTGAGCSGYFCDNVTRRNALVSRDPQAGLHAVGQHHANTKARLYFEELTSALNDEIVNFHAESGGESKVHPSTSSGHKSLLIQSRKIVNYVRQVGALRDELANWQQRHCLLHPREENWEENCDERFTRLQEFWGQYHESQARRPAEARGMVHHGDFSGTPLDVTASSDGLDDSEVDAFISAARATDTSAWTSCLSNPSRRKSARDIAMPGAQPSWKSRPARSNCTFGRRETIHSTPVLQPCPSSLQRATSAAVWHDRAERTFSALANGPLEAKSERRLSTTRSLANPALSSFLTPKHLQKGGALSSTCSLPLLISSNNGDFVGRSGSATGRRPLASQKPATPPLHRLAAKPRAIDGGLQFTGSLLAAPGTNGLHEHSGGDDLPLSGAFRQPWRAAEAASLHAHASATGKYLQVCSDNGIVPSLLPFVTGHSASLVAAGKDFADGDLQAVTAMIQSIRVERVDLSDCVLLSDRSLVPFAQALLARPACDFLRSFSLRRCSGAGSPTVQLVMQLLGSPPGGAQRLQHLDLSGVSLGIKVQLDFCKAVRAHKTLHTVRLAETGLGQSAGARQCVLELAGSTTVQVLDLGWNCFDCEVFRALGEQVVETGVLRSLTISSASAAAAKDCTPVVFFVEALVACRTLTQLDLSMNRVDARAAIVVEDVLEHNMVLKDLDVSSNPLGSFGIRSILRALARDTNGLINLELGRCSRVEGKVENNSDPIFNATNPSGRYRLNLERPEDRSILRMLYKTCERFGLSPDAVFSDINCSVPYQHPQKSNGVWEVPRNGVLRTLISFERMKEGAPLKDVDESDFDQFLTRVLPVTHILPSFKRMVVLTGILSLYMAEQSRLLLDALARNFLMTYAQLRTLCDTREVTLDVVSSLLPVLHGGALARAMALQLVSLPVDLLDVLNNTRSFLNFSPQNPTGHYALDLADPAQHMVAEQILLMDMWESGIAARRSLIDTSQRGNRSCLRNEKHNSRDLKAKSALEWHLPESEVFEFDYSTNQRPPVDARALEDTTLSNILVLLQDSMCKPLERVQAIRDVSARIYVTCLQVRSLIGVFRDSSARLELLIALFYRIVDIWNEKVFRVRFENPDDVFRLQDRLGYLSFFPFIQPEQTQFRFDFAYHDQRLAANLLCIQAQKEGGNVNFKETEAFLADGTIDPLTMGIPRSWEIWEKMPKTGGFSTKYSCSPDLRKYAQRKANLEAYGFWNTEVGEHEVMWWSTINGVPYDVVQYLLFILQKFGNTDDAFVFIDGAEGNGEITFAGFLKSVKAMNCQKFKGPNEELRVRAVFECLDTSGERILSRKEWKVLDEFRQEVVLSLQNFRAFLDRMFVDDLEDAWDYFDRERSDRVSMERWCKACAESRYFGPVKPIFNYLDKDANGTVTFQEFRLLEKFKEGMPDERGEKSAG